MRTRYKIVETENFYFVTSSFQNWLPIFDDEKYIQILFDAIKYNQKSRDLKVYAYVIMPDHLHMILQSEKLTNIMQSIKSYTAKEIIKELKSDNKRTFLRKLKLDKLEHKTQSEFQVWQEGFHPQIILNDMMMEQKCNYIHMNPVRKGLVDAPEKWKYSSYLFYYFDKKVDLEIVKFD